MDKKVVIGIATYNGKGRSESLQLAIKSLSGHGAEIFLYDNTKEKTDLADNGKFYGLTQITEPCYYFTCDDDLIYPETYIPDMIQKIKEHGCIVSHHGRILVERNIKYQRGHKCFRCLDAVHEDAQIDVPGTGCTAFDTEYFNPVNLYKSPELRMADLFFGLEAAAQNKKIMVLKHPAGYIKYAGIEKEETIWHRELNNPKQTEIAKQIFDLKISRR